MANRTKQAQPPLLLGVAPEQLPHAYRRTLDEKRPLHHPSHFIPHGIVSLWVPPLIGAPALVMTLLTVTNLPFGSGSFIEFAFVFTVMCLSAWGTVWSVRRWQFATRQRRLLAENRWKEGLHVRPEALLVFYQQYRQEGPRCFLLPRTAVVEMAILVVSSGGKYPERQVILRYRDENGQVHPFRLPMVRPPFRYTGRWTHLDEMPKPPEVKERYLYYQLERWIETGEFVWPTSRAIHR